ncbi:hypothetical protein Cgig2_033306 [Carnegiea gigantea]|uniref:Uncharacterized protein n=1 Tax=Carnegiea gigantea TaxID=171969 RepID=A0A9Q1KV84_9CARY|nr:hypothetical protein Cgig2_033306 [Carnegiea gigantea]
MIALIEEDYDDVLPFVNISESILTDNAWCVFSHHSIMELGYEDNGSPTLHSSRSWKSMEVEIQSSLEKLVDINDSMSRCAAAAAPATSVTQKLARHRDILHEFTQEFRRIKGNKNSMREHAELLSSVRDDISEYKVQSEASAPRTYSCIPSSVIAART